MSAQRYSFLLPCLLVTLLASCGFQLRGELRLPAALKEIRVEVVDPYTAIDDHLEDALRRAGARIVEAADGPSASLRVTALTQVRNPLSVDAAGRAQEYELVYSADFKLVGPDGKDVVPNQHIDLRRDYLFDTARALGNRAEEDLVMAELQRDMADAILRRIDVALR